MPHYEVTNEPPLTFVSYGASRKESYAALRKLIKQLEDGMYFIDAISLNVNLGEYSALVFATPGALD